MKKIEYCSFSIYVNRSTSNSKFFLFEQVQIIERGKRKKKVKHKQVSCMKDWSKTVKWKSSGWRMVKLKKLLQQIVIYLHLPNSSLPLHFLFFLSLSFFLSFSLLSLFLPSLFFPGILFFKLSALLCVPAVLMTH